MFEHVLIVPYRGYTNARLLYAHQLEYECTTSGRVASNQIPMMYLKPMEYKGMLSLLKWSIKAKKNSNVQSFVSS